MPSPLRLSCVPCGEDRLHTWDGHDWRCVGCKSIFPVLTWKQRVNEYLRQNAKGGGAPRVGPSRGLKWRYKEA